MTHDIQWASPNATTRALLAEEATRRRISAVVRRRVPDQEADDVVQAVLCDALAAARVPADADDLARWLVGVARHKVADHHRERARHPHGEALEDDVVRAAPTPLEARSLLRAVAEDAGRESRGAQAFEWVVREAEGERLDVLAREAALEPAAVRQRVSRLRRVLQRRWLREALLLVAAAMAGVLVVNHTLTPDVDTRIVAEPADGTEALLAALQGRWNVEQLTPDAGAFGSSFAATVASVRVEGDRVTFVSPVKQVERRFRVEPREANGQGALTLVILDPNGGTVTATGTFDGPDRLRLESRDSRWAGRATLAR